MKTKITKKVEIFSVEHNGIFINVKIDYLCETISLIESSFNDSSLKDKIWIFSNREVEYMQGWRNILEAMSVATQLAEEKLRAYIEEKKDIEIQKINKVRDMIKSIERGDVKRKKAKK